jgi:hypothetical protein
MTEYMLLASLALAILLLLFGIVYWITDDQAQAGAHRHPERVERGPTAQLTQTRMMAPLGAPKPPCNTATWPLTLLRKDPLPEATIRATVGYDDRRVLLALPDGQVLRIPRDELAAVALDRVRAVDCGQLGLRLPDNDTVAIVQPGQQPLLLWAQRESVAQIVHATYALEYDGSTFDELLQGGPA